jgi:hypothetical protein
MGILERIFQAALANILSSLKNYNNNTSYGFWEKYRKYKKYDENYRNSDYYEQAKSYYQNYYRKKYSYQKQNYNASAKNQRHAQYYANLELPNGAGLEEVKKAWKRLLKKYHPDKHSLDEEKRKVATILTQKLNEAYFALEKELKK